MSHGDPAQGENLMRTQHYEPSRRDIARSLVLIRNVERTLHMENVIFLRSFEFPGRVSRRFQ